MRGTGGEDWEQEQAGVSTAERELLTAICNKTRKQNRVLVWAEEDGHKDESLICDQHKDSGWTFVGR